MKPAAAPPPAVAEALAAFARRYAWDMDAGEALGREDKVILRVMDLGVWEDVLTLEAALGRERLAAVMMAATAGAMRERSWHFWAVRLGLGDGGVSPPMPVRSFG